MVPYVDMRPGGDHNALTRVTPPSGLLQDGEWSFLVATIAGNVADQQADVWDDGSRSDMQFAVATAASILSIGVPPTGRDVDPQRRTHHRSTRHGPPDPGRQRRRALPPRGLPGPRRQTARPRRRTHPPHYADHHRAGQRKGPTMTTSLSAQASLVDGHRSACQHRALPDSTGITRSAPRFLRRVRTGRTSTRQPSALLTVR